MKVLLLSVLAVAIFGVMMPSVNAVHTMEHEQYQESVLLDCSPENYDPNSCNWDEVLAIHAERLNQMDEQVKQIEKQKSEEEKLFKGVLWVVVILVVIFLIIIPCIILIARRRRSKYHNYYK